MNFKGTLQVNYGAKTANIFFNLENVSPGRRAKCHYSFVGGELFLSHSLKHCCGPDSHPRLLFFTPCCTSGTMASKHMASSTQHELRVSSRSQSRHLSTYVPSLLPPGPRSTEFTPSCSPSPFEQTRQKPSYPRLLWLTSQIHTDQVLKIHPPLNPHNSIPPAYCFGSRTTHPTLMHGLLMDLWACPQFILHTKTRMAPRHTSGDVIFLLKVLQSLSHNLQDQAQTP